MARTLEVPFDDELVEGGPLIFHAELGSPVLEMAPERRQGHTSTRRQAPKREQFLPKIALCAFEFTTTGLWQQVNGSRAPSSCASAQRTPWAFSRLNNLMLRTGHGAEAGVRHRIASECPAKEVNC